MANVIADYPAYSVIAYEGQELIEGATIALPFLSKRYGTQYRRFILGSVAGYAEQNGKDVAAALNRARNFGHELFFAFAVAAVLSAEPRAKEAACIGVSFGSTIRFAGKTFRLDRAPNDNIRLIEITE